MESSSYTQADRTHFVEDNIDEPVLSKLPSVPLEEINRQKIINFLFHVI